MDLNVQWISCVMRISSLAWPTKYIFFYPQGGVRLSPLGKSATVGLMYRPRMNTDDSEAAAGNKIGVGAQVLGGNMPQCHFVHHKSNMT